MVRKRPVDSTTYSAPTSSHLRLAGSISAVTRIFAVDDELAIFGVNFNRAIEATMHGVVFEHVCQVFNRAEVVDAYDFDIIASLCCAENKTTNTTETINITLIIVDTLLLKTKITFVYNSKNLKALLLTM